MKRIVLLSAVFLSFSASASAETSNAILCAQGMPNAAWSKFMQCVGKSCSPPPVNQSVGACAELCCQMSCGGSRTCLATCTNYCVPAIASPTEEGEQD